jgi:ribonuclease Z
MSNMKRFKWCWGYVAAVILVLTVLTASCVSGNFLEKTIVSQQEKQKRIHAEYLNIDKIEVVLVGTAGPMSPDLAQNSTAVFVNGKFLLFDAGDYAQKRMEQFNLPVSSLDAVFLTHFHNDHIADLGEVMQRSFMLGREKALYVYGPTGTEQLVNGIVQAYCTSSYSAQLWVQD